MEKKKSFFAMVCALAVPVALQSMLQASFSIVDQIMIGQLGSVSVAGVGLASKFASIFSVVVSAVGAVAGIMISQFLGQKNDCQVRKSFSVNLILTLGLAVAFTVLCAAFPRQIMRIYTKDASTLEMSAAYLQILAGTFMPMAGATMLATLYRCVEKAKLPLYASVSAALVNTGLNYLLIFGKLGFPEMGARGAAIATLISQLVNLAIMVTLILIHNELPPKPTQLQSARFSWAQYAAILIPILICEVIWSLGENVYAAIYGRMGTSSSAAMTLINPIQGLMLGALCGLSQAAGVIVGKLLGSREYEEAYRVSKKLIIYGAVGSVVLSGIIVLTRGAYVRIYQVEQDVRRLTEQILLAFALVAPFKVLNMILGGGIIRSGGKTKYVMIIDIIGTWIFGVPLGLLSAFVWQLSVPCVYFLLSLEECIRFCISLVVLRRRKWMQSLNGG